MFICVSKCGKSYAENVFSCYFILDLIFILVQSSWGPLGRDVNSLVVFLKALLVPEMHRLDPALPVMPFKDEVIQDLSILFRLASKT